MVKNDEVLLLGTVHADLWGFGRLEAALDLVEPAMIAVETNEQRARFYEGRFDYDAPALYAAAPSAYLGLLQRFVSDRRLFDEHRARYRAAGLEWTERQVAAMDVGGALLAACYGFELKVVMKYVERHPAAERHMIDLPEENADAIRLSRGVEDGRPSARNLAFFAAHRDELDRGLAGYLSLVTSLQDAYYADAGGALRAMYARNVAAWDRLPRHDHYRRAMFDPRREPYMADRIRALRRRHPGRPFVAVLGATHCHGVADLLDDCPHSTLSLAELPLQRAA